MSPPELNTLHILHVTGVLVLIGYTFFAFAGPAESRKRVLMITSRLAMPVIMRVFFRFSGSGFANAMNVCAVSTNSEKI